MLLLIIKMWYESFIEKCTEKLTCRHCWAQITWWFSHYGWWITSEDALKRHEEQCSKNPDSLEWRILSDIKRCQLEARIFDCLNCQHYHKRCSGTKI